MKARHISLLLVAVAPAAFSQEAFKCKTANGNVYQDRPCHGEMPAAKPQAATATATATGAEQAASETQSRLERDKKYLAERADARLKAEARERVQNCEAEVAGIQSRIDRIASAPRTGYFPNTYGAAAIQLEESSIQTTIAALQSSMSAKMAECESHRKDLAALQK